MNNYFCYLTQFVVPFFAKATNERVFQELVDAKIKLAPFFYRRTTNVPTVILKSAGTILKAFFANGVESARDGFAPSCASFTISLVGGTKATTIIAIAGKHTVFTINNTCYQIAFAIGVCHTLMVDCGLCTGT